MHSYREKEPAVIGGLTLLLIVLWSGFLVHRAPAFPGSLLGHSLGMTGGLLMLVPLAYMIVKRIAWLRRWALRRWTMRTLLAWHIYAGIIGPVLVLLHTGHHFESPLGIALTATTMVVAISGFVGRFLLKRMNTEIRELSGRLEIVRNESEGLAERLAFTRHGAPADVSRGLWATVWRGLFLDDAAFESSLGLTRGAVRLAETQADLEFALGSHELFRRFFSRWLKLHIAISMALYVLLGLHIWATIYFGLRWLT